MAKSPSRLNIGHSGSPSAEFLRSIVAAVVTLGLIATTWALGGRASFAPYILATCAAVALIIALRVRWLDARWAAEVNGISVAGNFGLIKKGHYWIPWVALALWIGISLLNPAYEVSKTEGTEIVLTPIEHVGWLPISVDRATTVKSSLVLFAALVTGMVFPLAQIRRRSSIKCLIFLYTNAAIVAALGIVARFAGTADLWGVMIQHEGYFSVFRYYNHWSQYALLAITIGIFLFFHFKRNKGCSLWSRNSPLLLILCGGFFLYFSIPLSRSRSGVVLLALLTLILAVAVVWRFARRRAVRWRFMRIGIASIGLFMLCYVIYQASEEVLHARWDDTIRQWKQVTESGKPLGRYLIQAGTLEMIQERPLTGWGLGSFATIFPTYAPDDLMDESGQTRWYIEFAHQDWLQYTSELGLIGFALLIIPPACYAVRFAGLRRRKNGIAEPPIWLLSGIGLLSIWAMWDFPLSNPAILAHFAVVFAVAGRLARPRS